MLCIDKFVIDLLSSYYRIEVVNEQDRKKERSSNILAGLKVKKNREILPAHSLDRNLELLNIIRSQMEASVFCIFSFAYIVIWSLCLNFILSKDLLFFQ